MTASAQKSTNRHFRHTLKTEKPPQAIWAIWMDVPNWHQWDTGLKKAEAEGPLKLNTLGTITSLEGRESKFKVVGWEDGRSYTFRTALPLGGLFVTRYIETKQDGTYFTHEVQFKGFSGPIFAALFGKNFREMLPEVMSKVEELASLQ